MLPSNYCGKCREWTYASEEHPRDFTCEKCGGGGEMTSEESTYIQTELEAYRDHIANESLSGWITDDEFAKYQRKLNEWESELKRKRSEVE